MNKNTIAIAKKQLLEKYPEMYFPFGWNELPSDEFLKAILGTRNEINMGKIKYGVITTLHGDGEDYVHIMDDGSDSLKVIAAGAVYTFYKNNGALLSIIKSSGEIKTYSYDKNGLPKTESFIRANSKGIWADENYFEFDRNGNFLRKRNKWTY